MKTKNYVEYNSNNSGGGWWLKDKHWEALEKAGWVVAWFHLENKYTEKGDYVRSNNGVPKLVPIGTGGNKYGSWATKDSDGKYRWLGCVAKTAYRPGLSLREAADEWERVTGLSSTDAGCPCCGQPHNFTEYTRSGKHVASGPSCEYSASW